MITFIYLHVGLIFFVISTFLYLVQTFKNAELPLLYLDSGTFLAAIDTIQFEQKYSRHSEHVF